MFELIGIVAVTGLLLFFTWWAVGILWFHHAMTGLQNFDWEDLLAVLVLSAMVVVGWWFWWEHIGSHITVSFK